MDPKGRQEKFGISGKGLDRDQGGKTVGPPREDCVGLCNQAFGQGAGFSGCAGGTYSGVQSCECDCCDQYVSWTENTGGGSWEFNDAWDTGWEWFPDDEYTEQNVMTYCSCGACANGYNDCINQCMSGSPEIGATGYAEGAPHGWRRGGRVNNRRRFQSGGRIKRRRGR